MKEIKFIIINQQVAPEEYLEALELSDWNVHNAIKVMRVKTTAGQAALEDCHKELLTSGGDVVKASAALVIGKKAQ